MRKRRRFSGSRIIWISVPISRSSTAIGWVGERLYAVILEMRNDEAGEFYHLVTLWKATLQEQELYEEHS